MKYQKNEIIGKMRDRLVIQNVVRSKSATGFVSETWSNDVTVWSKVDTKINQSNENIIDSKNTAKNTCEFLIRKTSSITEESRIVWNDKLYQVKNIQLSHDRRFITFTGVFFDSYDLKDELAVLLNSNLSALGSLSSILKISKSIDSSLNANATLSASFGNLVEIQALLNANANLSSDITKTLPLELLANANSSIVGNITNVKLLSSSVDANATITNADIKIVRYLNSSLTANATITSELNVTTQGVVTLDASLNGNSFAEGEIKLTKKLDSTLNANATVQANVQQTLLPVATLSASANLEADAKVVQIVSLQANANAQTNADARLTRIATASLNANATSVVDAQISRTLELNANATATTSVEAGIGITFVSALLAQGTVTSATLFRSANIDSSLTASANLTTSNLTKAQVITSSATANANLTTSNLTKAQVITSSPSASATVSSATLNLYDPNFSSVSLLLHGNGTNGSTTFTDSSSNNFTITANDNAQIDTTIKKFGTGSIELDGTGDYLTIPNNNVFNFGSDNFTIEFWIYCSAQTLKPIVHQTSYYSNTGWILYNYDGVNVNNTTRKLTFIVNNSFVLTTSSDAYIDNTWTHIAIVKNGTGTNNISIYSGGINIGFGTYSTAFANAATAFYIGATINGISWNRTDYFNGYLDDIRITKGVARYTTNFTPPSREFLDQ